jgi:hypothetical protein
MKEREYFLVPSESKRNLPPGSLHKPDFPFFDIVFNTYKFII